MHHSVAAAVKRWSIATASLLLAVGLASWWWFSEPRYKGKTTAGWLRLLTVSDSEHGYERLQSVSNAIVQLGPRALPCLLDYMGRPRSDFKEKCYELLGKQRIVSFRFADADNRHWLAAFGFQCLGTNAASAAPQLARWLFATNSPESCASALAVIGPAGIAVLNEASTNPAVQIRRSALAAAHNMKVDLSPTNVWLLATNSDVPTATLALRSLKRSVTEEQYFNALAEVIDPTPHPAARYAIHAMSELTNQWPRAFSHVAKTLTNPAAFWIRGAATNVLIKMDAARAAELGVNTNRANPSRRGRRGG